MKKLFLLSAFPLLFLNSCDSKNDDFQVSLKRNSEYFSLLFSNKSGKSICVDSHSAIPSSTQDPPDDILPGSLTWRNVNRSLVFNKKLRDENRIPKFYFFEKSGNFEIRDYNANYINGNYTIVLEGYFCDQLSSEQDIVQQFIFYQELKI
jgi:hypothetical protein